VPKIRDLPNTPPPSGNLGKVGKIRIFLGKFKPNLGKFRKNRVYKRGFFVSDVL
jgi:hypothetical protein